MDQKTIDHYILTDIQVYLHLPTTSEIILQKGILEFNAILINAKNFKIESVFRDYCYIDHNRPGVVFKPRINQPCLTAVSNSVKDIIMGFAMWVEMHSYDCNNKIICDSDGPDIMSVDCDSNVISTFATITLLADIFIVTWGSYHFQIFFEENCQDILPDECKKWCNVKNIYQKAYNIPPSQVSLVEAGARYNFFTSDNMSGLDTCFAIGKIIKYLLHDGISIFQNTEIIEFEDAHKRAEKYKTMIIESSNRSDQTCKAINSASYEVADDCATEHVECSHRVEYIHYNTLDTIANGDNKIENLFLNENDLNDKIFNGTLNRDPIPHKFETITNFQFLKFSNNTGPDYISNSPVIRHMIPVPMVPMPMLPIPINNYSYSQYLLYINMIRNSLVNYQPGYVNPIRPGHLHPVYLGHLNDEQLNQNKIYSNTKNITLHHSNIYNHIQPVPCAAKDSVSAEHNEVVSNEDNNTESKIEETVKDAVIEKVELDINILSNVTEDEFNNFDDVYSKYVDDLCSDTVAEEVSVLSKSEFPPLHAPSNGASSNGIKKSSTSLRKRRRKNSKNN